MVMQKFHNVRGIGEVGHTFYRIEGRGPASQVALSPELAGLVDALPELEAELDARWSIVEASFDAEIGRSLVGEGFELSDDGATLVSKRKRVGITRLRPALQGFQHARCFYCKEPLVESDVHVDHVFPFSFMTRAQWDDAPDLNAPWNLVLACSSCNLQKSNRRPTEAEVRQLIARNERIIASPHPLKRTLELTMGVTTARERLAFISAVDDRTLFR